jgi:hypothetical protein
MNEVPFQRYIDLFWRQLLVVSVGAIFIASLLWHFFPTVATDCAACDSSDYWKSSESFEGIRTSHYKLGTFFYPSLIGLVRYLPNYFNISTEIQYSLLSIVQLFLHLASVIALGYTIYLLTNNKFMAHCIIYIYGLNFFIIAYTNQVLADGVAISCLLIVVALFVSIIVNPLKYNKLIILFGLLSGLLPMIRPSLTLAAISLYGICSCIYIYKHQFKLNSWVVIIIGLCFFSMPAFFQLWLNPQILLNWSQQMKNNFSAYGTHGYKAMTILDPIPHMFVAFDRPMTKLVSSCAALQAPSTCMAEKLAHNPLPFSNYDFATWYAVKLLAINDQVYLTPYVHNFLVPNRNIWRLINCLFLSASIMGMIRLGRNLLKQPRKYFLYGFITVIILFALLIPPITSVFEEERFGLPFHPFFAFCASFFIADVLKTKNKISKYWSTMSFSLIALLLLMISLKIESTFGLRV